VQDEEQEPITIVDNLKSKGFNPEESTYGMETKAEEIAAQAKDREKVILLALEPGGFVKRLTRLLEDERPEVILVSLGAPQGFFRLPAGGLVFTYGHTPASLEGLSRVLAGEIPAEGRSPVTVNDT
ncbi:MAG: hypothetical protein ACOC86_05630, partial [Candidatus Bipolaricaulota bacterium]